MALVLGGPAASLLKSFPFQRAAELSSPAAGCFLAFDDSYTKNPHYQFWLNAALTHLYGWVFFGLACHIVPQSWQDAVVGRKIFRRWAAAQVRRARARAELLEINPFLWRAARSGRKRLVIWLVLGVSAALWSWFCPNLLDPGMDLFLLGSAGFVMKAWLAAEASRTFSEDRRSGGFELLLSTPLHERDIARGQWLALWRQFAMPAGAVLLAYLLFMLLEIRRWQPGDERMNLLALHLVFGGFLVADMIALSWEGMWLGLIYRKPNRAALMALTRILALPGALFFVLISLWALASFQNGSGNGVLGAAYAFWVLLGLGADLWFGLSARTKLRAQFRTVVAEGLARKRAPEPAPKAGPVLMEAQ